MGAVPGTETANFLEHSSHWMHPGGITRSSWNFISCWVSLSPGVMTEYPQTLHCNDALVSALFLCCTCFLGNGQKCQTSSALNEPWMETFTTTDLTQSSRQMQHQQGKSFQAYLCWLESSSPKYIWSCTWEPYLLSCPLSLCMHIHTQQNKMFFMNFWPPIKIKMINSKQTSPY